MYINNKYLRFLKRTRIAEFLILFSFRIIEFWCYTVCGIKFYRNYDRFYWENKIKYKRRYLGADAPRSGRSLIS